MPDPLFLIFGVFWGVSYNYTSVYYSNHLATLENVMKGQVNVTNLTLFGNLTPLFLIFPIFGIFRGV